MTDPTTYSAASPQDGINALAAAHRELTDLLEQLDGELSTSVGQWDDNARVAYQGAQLQWAASSKRQQDIVQRLVDVAEQS